MPITIDCFKAYDVRGRMPDIGGGFGAKFPVYTQQVLTAAVAAAEALELPRAAIRAGLIRKMRLSNPGWSIHAHRQKSTNP